MLVQKAFHWNVPIKNATEAPLEISNLMTSCHCTSISPASLSLLPGETGSVQLTLDLTTNNPQEAALAERNFSVNLFCTCPSARPRDWTWTVRGRVLTPLALSPPKLDFGDSLTAGGPVRSTTARARPLRGRVLDLKATCDPRLAGVVVQRDATTPADFVVSVTPSGDLPLGRNEFSIDLNARLESGETVEIPLPVVAPVQSEYEFSPGFSHLGIVLVGGSIEETVLLRSRKQRAFRVVDVEPSSADVTVETLPGEFQLGHVFRIRCAAGTPGPCEPTIRFQVLPDGASEPETAVLKLRYEVVAR